MIDFWTIYSLGVTALMGGFAWGWKRRAEIETFAIKLYIAAKDKNIDEVEFQDCADTLGKVIYKK